MQDRIYQGSTKTSCTARPDHTFGSDSDFRGTRPASPLRVNEQSLGDSFVKSHQCQERL